MKTEKMVVKYFEQALIRGIHGHLPDDFRTYQSKTVELTSDQFRCAFACYFEAIMNNELPKEEQKKLVDLFQQAVEGGRPKAHTFRALETTAPFDSSQS